MDTKQPASSLGGLVTIAATPEPVNIDTAHTAGLVVDMQNDFGAKGGLFDLAGHDLSLVRGTIAPTAKVLAALRRAGIRIVYLKMGYQPDLSDLGPPDSPNRLRHRTAGKAVRAPDGRDSRILIRDTWNTDILDELKPEPGDVVMYKTRYSGFYGTDLDSVLRQHQVTWLIVAGLSTSVCVESTIRDAMFRDYSCLLLSDCTALSRWDTSSREETMRRLSSSLRSDLAGRLALLMSSGRLSTWATRAQVGPALGQREA